MAAVALAIAGCDSGEQARVGDHRDAGRPDAQWSDAAPVFDAAPPDAAPPMPAACNPVTQDGCPAGQRCTQFVIQDEPYLTSLGCVGDGSIPLGAACTEGAAGVNGGADDCAGGGFCIAGQCKAICAVDPDTCSSGYDCQAYQDTFEDYFATTVGVCDTICNPVTQDCPLQTEACYLKLSNSEGHATCSHVPAMAADKMQGDTCYGPNATQCYSNGCAPGYGAYLFQGAGMARACTAFCAPVDTYLVNPDGVIDDGAGLNGGADPDGSAPSDCSEATIGVPDHQCRFFQNYFIDGNGDKLGYIAAEYGFCVPVGDTYRDCTASAVEHLYKIYDDAGGGTDGDTAVSMFCDADPVRCAAGCTSLATEQTLFDAYCTDVNPTGPTCSEAALGRFAVRDLLDRRWDRLHGAGSHQVSY